MNAIQNPKFQEWLKNNLWVKTVPRTRLVGEIYERDNRPIESKLRAENERLQARVEEMEGKVKLINKMPPETIIMGAEIMEAVAKRARHDLASSVAPVYDNIAKWLRVLAAGRE